MICNHLNDCDACSNLSLSYNKTLELKLIDFKEKVLFSNYYPQNLDNIKIIPSLKPYNYRLRAQLHIKNGIIGFFKRKTNNLVEIKNCKLLDSKINEKISSLKYPDNFNGTIELYIKNNKVYERLVEKKYDNLFFQVNEEVNKILVKEVLKSLDLKNTDHVLELYCGNGNFTFEISKKAKVTAIDINTPNKTYNNIDFINKNIVSNLFEFKKHNYTKLLLDPPRNGLSFSNYSFLLKNNFQIIVYVSCNTKSLIKNAIKFKEHSYFWKTCTLLDMFPFTNYIESVNIFLKKINN
jgi:tRNA/tmRNA/rRNA uracil-C5-methylase (TrmA/RlmC/RlmD family)